MCDTVRKFKCVLCLLKENVSFGEHEMNRLPGSATWFYEQCTVFLGIWDNNDLGRIN